MDILYTFLGILNEMSPYILLGFLIAGLLHAFVPASLMLKHLSGKGWKPVIKAALFGIPLPLCSCGVLPMAVSLRRQGASKAASTSFLIATPQTGVDSIAATYSLLGLPFAVIRPIAALGGAIAGGVAVGRWGNDDSSVSEGEIISTEVGPKGFFAKMAEALRYGFIDMVASVGKWLVIGLVVAALITVFVPDSLFIGLSEYPLLAMLAVVVVAVPMYICATGSIPIALSLMLKGLSPGIAFVMLMAGPAANFASIMILSRTYGRKATAIYITTVVLTAIGFGLIIDKLLPASWFSLSGSLAESCHSTLSIFDTVCSIVLVTLLIVAAIKTRSHHQSHEIEENMTQKFKIEGMACVHCKGHVERAISDVEGVDAVTVDLGSGIACVEGNADAASVSDAVHKAGYTATPI